MIRRLAFSLLLLAPSAAMADERRYPVADFDRVVVAGPYSVRLVPGRTSSAVATGDRRGIDTLDIDTTGRTLRIRRAETSRSGFGDVPAGPVAIELATRELRSARLVGPGRMEIEDISGMKIELVVEGGGTLRASGIRADELSLGLRGSGRLDIGGTTETLNVIAEGSGDLDSSRLAAENATVRSATSGTVTIAASETAEIDSNGVGLVQVIGGPDCVVRGVAAGQVRCGRSQQR